MYNKLRIETTPLLNCELPKGSKPRDANGIYTFADRFNQFYLDDKRPQLMPELGVWTTQAPQLTEIGALFSMSRGVLVSKKTLDIISNYRLAPYEIYKVPYEIRYKHNPSWDEAGVYFYLLFYTSGFNYIDFTASFFYSHVYTEKDMIIDDNLQFSNHLEFINEFKKSLFIDGIKLSPRSIKLLPSFSKYDMFGIFLFEDDLLISQELSTACKKKHVFNRYNKAIVLDYEIEWTNA